MNLMVNLHGQFLLKHWESLKHGLEGSLVVFSRAGIRVLRDEAAEIRPGLVLAGVDDLSARRQFGEIDHAVERTLASRPPGAVILLSHSPWEVERAAALGAGLMLSGHTHDGQIWPFRYLVRLAYPYVTGRYAIAGMTLLVSRGTGFWGPPMRLFRRSEITVITLTRADGDTR
jgi:predicted MPP superfamily phosphohydrolase